MEDFFIRDIQRYIFKGNSCYIAQLLLDSNFMTFVGNRASGEEVVSVDPRLKLDVFGVMPASLVVKAETEVWIDTKYIKN